MDRANEIMFSIDDIIVPESPTKEIKLVDIGHQIHFNDIDIDIVIEDSKTKQELGIGTLKYLSIIVCVSLAVHFAFLTLLKNLGIQIPHLTIEEIKPINATLWFPTPEKVEPEAIPEALPVQETKIEETPSPITAEQPEPEPTPEIQTPPASIEPAPQVIVEEVTPQSIDIPRTENVAPERPANSSDTIDWSQFGQNSAISKHLDAVNHSQQSEMLQNAVRSRELEQYQNSIPNAEILAERAEEARQMPTTKVDCSDTTAQSLAMISTILGGTLRCTKQPKVDDFINARLGKQDDK